MVGARQEDGRVVWGECNCRPQPSTRGNVAPSAGAAGTVDLDAIEARANAATPGPWGHYSTGSYVYATRTKVCQLEDPWIANGNQRNDAAFIAHAREDVPALIAEVRRLREELAVAEGRAAQGAYLVAVIHGDGGQYYAEHGSEKAHADTITKWHDLAAERDRLAADADLLDRLEDAVFESNGIVLRHELTGPPHPSDGLGDPVYLVAVCDEHGVPPLAEQRGDRDFRAALRRTLDGTARQAGEVRDVR